MLAFACACCRKRLSVQDEQAGKKVRCPTCGAVVAVPLAAAAASNSAGPPTTGPEGAATLPPAPLAAEKCVLFPREQAPSGQESVSDVEGPTASGAGRPADVRRAAAAEGLSPELTAFLAPPQAGDELGRLGGFRILKVLGHGGMGVVFQGEDPRLGRKVAIKAMLPHLAGSSSARERFLREARAAAALEHDHVVPIFHVAEDRGAPFIVMPLLKGETLEDRLKRAGKLPLQDVLRIGWEMAEGLAAAHERGLVHRDIKPANVWLEGQEGRVKILDFGLARATTDEAQLTQSGAIVGTPAYMAPEQAGGEQPNPRSDLFSLGCVLYRLCTGSPPFRGKDTIAVLVAVATENPRPPAAVRPEVPAALSALVMRLLAKKPQDRPASAHAVAAELRKLQRPLGPAARPGQGAATTPPEFAGLPWRRPAWPWLAGVAVVGLGVLGLLILLLGHGDNPRHDGSSPLAAHQPLATPQTTTREEAPPVSQENDPLPPGSIWAGKRVWRNGRTFTCELRVRERDGARFKATLSVGGREPIEVEGLLADQAISWREVAPNLVTIAQGRVQGDQIHFTFVGRARGHGDLKRRDGR
jgi:serine/threonine protein kinase